MIIETEIEPGCSLWGMHFNEVTEYFVDKISISCQYNFAQEKPYSPTFSYYIGYRNIPGIREWINGNELNRKYFKSKEELIKSL